MSGPPAWHARSIADTLTGLDATASGLPDAEYERRLARFGPNHLTLPPSASIGEILVAQLRSVIVALLVAAVVISLLVGDRLEAAAIGAVLILNTLIGFVTELRARRAMDALLQLDTPRAAVVRDGRVRDIDARDLVPGDVIDLEAGQQVPADGRLLHVSGLTVDEAPLTGESLPVSKAADITLPADTLLADRRNLVYKGTMAVTGLGRAVVTSTGNETEVGRIGALVGGVIIEPTPLERRLDALGKRLVWLAVGVAALVGGLGAVQGVPIALALETALALAVAAVPESLPAVATIALAVGLHRMARRHAVVRRLPAVESLGSTTVICTDKTGTLTSGRMSVVRVWTDEREYPLLDTATERESWPETIGPVLEAALLASRPPADPAPGTAVTRGDPEDAAVFEAAARISLDRNRIIGARPLVALLPFSSERKLMAAFHRVDGATVAYAKGAPRAILRLSSERLAGGRRVPLDDDGRAQLLHVNEALASAGLRVLAVAAGDVAGATEAALSGLTFLGFLGLADPPAPGVKETIARLRRAGLRTIMLTGDQRLTAEAVGRELGLIDGDQSVLDGRELERDATGVTGVLAMATALSRVSPEHKIVVVQSLQKAGEVVAMIGDGVNDAPALRQADVGVAMGVRGTDVAKQAAAIVLADDRFATIAAAVEEGRVIFENIRKFVFYLFSCNVAEVLVLLGAGLAGLPLPLVPLQLLWLNLVTDTFPALALAVEPADGDVMRRPPRRADEAVLSPAFMREILFFSALITAATLAAFVWTLSHAPERATTVAFMTLALAQVGHLGNARSASAVLTPRRMFANPFALLGAGVSVALQLAAVSVPPLTRVLHLSPLDSADWIVILASAAIPAVVGQVIKLIAPRA